MTRMTRGCVFAVMGLSILLAGGCAAMKKNTDASTTMPPVTFEARYTTAAVNVDGKLDDAVWQQATAYDVVLPLKPPINNGVPEDPGRVRFAWDDQYFYLACEFTDRDLVAEGEKDGEHHYQKGDLAELFLKPDTRPGYWELYVSPKGHQTVFYFPGKGRLGLPSHFESRSILKVGAVVNGTLNNWQDTDKGWTGEMAVPISELREKSGGDFRPGGQPWRIFVGRYNYSVYRTLGSGPELSSAPQLPVANWHDLANYAHLKLVK